MKNLLILIFLLPFVSTGQTILKIGTTGYVTVNGQNYARRLCNTYYGYTRAGDSTLQLYLPNFGYVAGQKCNLYLDGDNGNAPYSSMVALHNWANSHLEPNVDTTSGASTLQQVVHTGNIVVGPDGRYGIIFLDSANKPFDTATNRGESVRIYTRYDGSGAATFRSNERSAKHGVGLHTDATTSFHAWVGQDSDLTDGQNHQQSIWIESVGNGMRLRINGDKTKNQLVLDSSVIMLISNNDTVCLDAPNQTVARINTHLVDTGNLATIWTKSTMSDKLGDTSLATATGAISNTETIVLNTIPFPANRLVSNTHVQIQVFGTCTSTGGNGIVSVKLGTTATPADGTIATFTSTGSGSGTNQPFSFTVDLFIHTVGASATCTAYISFVAKANIGISNGGPNFTNPMTCSTFNTTTANNILSLTFTTSAATMSAIFADGHIRFLDK